MTYISYLVVTAYLVVPLGCFALRIESATVFPYRTVPVSVLLVFSSSFSPLFFSFPFPFLLSPFPFPFFLFSPHKHPIITFVGNRAVFMRFLEDVVPRHSSK